MTWGFYGRQEELRQLGEILARGRWFFVKLTGRRRIGKTTLIQQALPAAGRRVFYVQVPDSGPAGVLSAVAGQGSRVAPPNQALELTKASPLAGTTATVSSLDEVAEPLLPTATHPTPGVHAVSWRLLPQTL